MPMIDVYAAADIFSASADRELGEALTLSPRHDRSIRG